MYLDELMRQYMILKSNDYETTCMNELSDVSNPILSYTYVIELWIILLNTT